MKKSTIWKKLLMVLGALVAVVAIVVASVYGTIAYLSSAAVIQNSFTVGKVGITMTESAVDADGHKIPGAARVMQNHYTLVAGAAFDKDPVIYVDSQSQDSYLFIIVRNDLTSTTFTPGSDGSPYGSVSIDPSKASAEDPNEDTLLAQVYDNGWLPIASVATGNVYVYAGDTGAAKHVRAGEEIKVFQKLFISHSINDFTPFEAAQINVRAFAIQDTGFNGDVMAAWNAVVSQYSNVIIPTNPSVPTT